jgi:hypothetical protein
MTRSLRAFLPVAGPQAALVVAFTGDPDRWLPAARRDGDDEWTVRLRAGGLTRPVHARLGEPWQAGATWWRTLSWDPATEPDATIPVERLLPSLDGELGLHTDETGRTTLVLDARYRPPGGALGAAMDAVALHRVARSSVERLLEDVGARLAGESQHLDAGTESGASDGNAPHQDGATSLAP